ncbi:major facilitator family transporter [Actinomyces sp. oral taxon 180 str. F0310]|nr:major facilitator family transporter [Actinomyces sp. oral taxon 180 str. F0310]
MRKVLRGVYLRRIVFIGVIWLCQAIPMFALYTYGPQTIGDVLAGIRAL